MCRTPTRVPLPLEIGHRSRLVCTSRYDFQPYSIEPPRPPLVSQRKSGSCNNARRNLSIVPTFRVVTSSFHSSRYSALTLRASCRLRNFRSKPKLRTVRREIEEIFFFLVSRVLTDTKVYSSSYCFFAHPSNLRRTRF